MGVPESGVPESGVQVGVGKHYRSSGFILTPDS